MIENRFTENDYSLWNECAFEISEQELEEELALFRNRLRRRKSRRSTIMIAAAVAVVAAKEFDIWDGTTATNFAGGTGTKEDPYLISNGAELHKMAMDGPATTKGKYYKITADIYLNDVSKSDWKANAKPWSSKAFQGHLDGDGHVIYGVHNVNTATNGFSAFLVNSYLSADNDLVSIKNLGIENSYFQGDRVAAFLGKTDGAGTDANFTMENCYAGDSVEVVGKWSGGLIAYSNKNNITINNCYFTGSLSSSATQKGGLIAFTAYADADAAKTVQISNSYAATAGNDPVFSDESNTQYINYTNVYGTAGGHAEATGITVLTKEQMTGLNAVENMSGLDFMQVWNVVAGGTPSLVKPGEKAIYGRFVNIRIDLLADAEDGDNINADESFDIRDLVFAMDRMTTVQN